MPETLEPFLSADRALGLPPVPQAALDRLALRSRAVDACVAEAASDHERTRCVVEGVVGPNGLSPTSTAVPWQNGTVTRALEIERGTCASLAAIALALAERTRVPMRLVILGTHVVVEDPAAASTGFELLDGGRSTRLQAVARSVRDAGPPQVIATVEDFLPFYCDQLAVRASETGDDAVAEEAFRAAIAHAPRSWRIRFNYGTHLLTRGRAEDALRELKRATRRGCPLADCWSNLGVAYARVGEPRSAVKSLKRAISISPDHADAKRNLEALTESRQP